MSAMRANRRRRPSIAKNGKAKNSIQKDSISSIEVPGT